MERIGFLAPINLGNVGSNKVILRQTSCFQYANIKVNFQERNVVFMDFSFSLGIVWSHSSMDGKEYFLKNLFKLTAFKSGTKQ